MRVESGVALVALLAWSAGATAAPPAAPPDTKNFPMITAPDFGRPSTVMDGGCFISVYPPITLADGMAQTLQNAIKQAADYGKRVGADGMTAMMVSWETPNNTGAKGRVLLCGTFVKFK